MPVTEFVFPSLKPDQALRDEMVTKLPESLKTTFANVRGLLVLYTGHILREDGVDVSEVGRICLTLEWDSASSFDAFFNSAAFHSFKTGIIPYVSAPAIPELFASPFRSIDCTSATVVQVIKVKVEPNSNNSDLSACSSVWEDIKVAFENTHGKGRPFFDGSGIGHVKDVFLGMVGWGRLEDYEAANQDPNVQLNLRKLSNAGQMSSLLIELRELGSA